jgi:hypothetical protein
MGFFSNLLFQPTAIPTSATQPIAQGGRQNTIRTTWIAPKTIQTAQQAMEDVKNALNTYPQQGQANIDKGGWNIVQEETTTSNNNKNNQNLSFRAEFTSGSGFFAKLLNGGQGFIDDLLVEIVPPSSSQPQSDNANLWSAEVRSSSRMGKSDLGVNQKRVSYLAAKMREQGWDAPEPKYS